MEDTRSLDMPNAFIDGRRIFTRNLTPGKRVYGEELIVHDDIEYRHWNPRRSKLAALVLKGAKTLPFKKSSKVLYLGAAAGTTPSHVSDIVVEGIMYCVEISTTAFRKLVRVCEDRNNMVPILGDARKPDTYSNTVGRVDIVYQDVAQRDQVQIFLKNMRFLKDGGTSYLMVKARSIDVAGDPRSIANKGRMEIEEHGLEVLEVVGLEPFEKDHACIVALK
jgi:fibrillarin-like pre-rRNA processing protein